MEIKINIIPMAKQSARFAKRGAFMHSYQPKKIVDWVCNVKGQLIKQLGPDWNAIDEPIIITNLVFGFPCLKSFTKKKLLLVDSGDILYKSTKPDLDNIQKNLFDACNEIVWKDDALVCEIKEIKKIYAREPYILMEIQYNED